MIDLFLYLMYHFGGKHHILIAALEEILSAEIGVLVEYDLIHIEFVQVGIKKRYNNRVELHNVLLSVITGYLSDSFSLSREPLRAFQG